MKKITKYFSGLMAAIMLIAAITVSAAASDMSIEEQMAANSAAWWVAYYAGDMETCERLHRENEELAKQLAGEGGESTYDEESGSWDITTEEGDHIGSSGENDGGKSNDITYTTTTEDGDTSSVTDSTYTESSIGSYMDNGGTKEGLMDSYNNAGEEVTESGNYGSNADQKSAAEEAAVVQALLGLSDEETAQLQEDLESAKQAYEEAQDAYNEAVRNGDEEAAAKAREQMDKAHEEAEEVRSQYNYSGDMGEAEDGGYFNPTYPEGGGISDPGDYPWPEDEDEYFTITSSGGNGGSISPLGTKTVEQGGSQSYSITANEGYRIKSVKVDGIEQGAVSSYTFRNIQSNHTISVTFEKKTFTISASAGPGGSISPSGMITVNYGDSISFGIVPDWGYKVERVIVDGADRGALNAYTFGSVRTDHTISVSFVPSGYVDLDDPEVVDDDGEIVSDGDGIKSGYGIFASVAASYDGVTDVKMTVTYDFGFGAKTVIMEETGRGTFEYPVNAASPLGKRCIYIPVETQDGTYTLIFTITAKNVRGEILTETSTATVVVRGNMYEDDFTSDS